MAGKSYILYKYSIILLTFIWATIYGMKVDILGFYILSVYAHCKYIVIIEKFSIKKSCRDIGEKLKRPRDMSRDFVRYFVLIDMASLRVCIC